MGNAEGTEGGWAQAGLRFVQLLEDRHFGEVHIFRSEEGRFVMRVRRSFVEDDDRQRQFQRVLECGKTVGEGIVPVLHVETVREKGICIQYEVSHLYTEYYNYTLLDLLASKKDIDEPELWCLLDALLRLTANLARSEFAIPLSLDNVFLTLKGRPCVYLYHLQSMEENIHYSMSELVGRMLLQLATGQQLSVSQGEPMNLLGPLSKLCGRCRLLGRVVKELVNGEKTEAQVLEEMDQMVAVGRIKRAQEIRLNKFKYLIPDAGFETQLQDGKKEGKGFQGKLQRRNEGTEGGKGKGRGKGEGEGVKQSEKKGLHEESNGKGNELVACKMEASKMLVELQRRKEENRLQMERFQLRKEELLNHSEKENRENMDNHPRMEHLRQSEKRTPSTTAGQRRPMDNSRHSRRR